MKKLSLFLFCSLLFAGAALAQTNTNRDTVYNLVDQMPSFKGNLSTYLRNHLHYPQAAFNNNIEGTAYVSFVVNSTGEIKDVKIEKGISPDLDSAAIVVLSAMPKWNPGKLNGTAVKVRCHLPVKFILDKPKTAIDTTKPKRNFCDRKGFYIDPYSGIEIGIIALNNGGLPFSTISDGFMPIITGGAEFGYMFNNHIGLFVSAQYQKYNGHYFIGKQLIPQSSAVPNAISPSDTIMGTGFCLANVNYSISYLEAPILFRYISTNPGKAGLDLEAGFSIGFPQNITESGNISQVEQTYVKEPTTGGGWYWDNAGVNSFSYLNAVSKIGNVAKFDLGFVLNIAVIIPLSNIYSLSLGMMNTYKLNSVGNGGQDIVNFGNGNVNYYQGQYGNANSLFLNIKLDIHIVKSGCPSPAEK